MRSLESAEILAIQAGTVRARDIVRVIARNRSTGDPVPFAFWSDAGSVQLQIVDALTGGLQEIVAVGSGALISISSIRLTSDLSVRPVEIDLSPLNPQVNAMYRTYDVRGAPVAIYRGYLDAANRLAAPAKARFVGFVDEAPSTVPSEGGEASLRLRCASHTRELRLSNPAVRSHEDQRLRDPADNFFMDVGTVGDWEIFWGGKPGQVGQKGGKRFMRSRKL